MILFDEAELIGGLGKKARLEAYQNMARFLIHPKGLHSVFSLFVFTSSYDTDVIQGKHDFENLEDIYPDNQEPMKSVLNMILKAPALKPLSNSEINQILEGIISLHGEAYHWEPNTAADLLACHISKAGFLLRTKLRAAIEYLDQMYQYGSNNDIFSKELDEVDLSSLDSPEE